MDCVINIVLGGVGEGGLMCGGTVSYSTGRIASKHFPLRGELVSITCEERWKIPFNLIVLDPPFRFRMDKDSCHLAAKILSDKQNGILK